MANSLEALVEAVETTFTAIHDDVFRGDDAANPWLRVEAFGATMASDTPVLILITPWTMNGLAFPPSDEFPASLALVGRQYPVYAHSLDALGDYRGVVLLGDVSGLDSPAQARELAAAMIGLFRDAVAAVREVTLPDPSRRRLLTGFRN